MNLFIFQYIVTFLYLTKGHRNYAFLITKKFILFIFFYKKANKADLRYIYLKKNMRVLCYKCLSL